MAVAAFKICFKPTKPKTVLLQFYEVLQCNPVATANYGIVTFLMSFLLLRSTLKVNLNHWCVGLGWHNQWPIWNKQTSRLDGTTSRTMEQIFWRHQDWYCWPSHSEEKGGCFQMYYQINTADWQFFMQSTDRLNEWRSEFGKRASKLLKRFFAQNPIYRNDPDAHTELIAERLPYTWDGKKVIPFIYSNPEV